MNPHLASWVLVGEFIFTLAMALKCYPLQPGGLLAVQAILMGLASPENVLHEAEKNFEVIMLLMFMVAGIYFLKELLLFTFTKILLKVKSKAMLSLLFCAVSAVLSAFLDALTVTAVVITVAHGFLTLSLLPHFFSTTYTVQTPSMGVNYGLNKVRFMAPVRVNSRLRALLHLAAVENIDGGALQLTWRVSIECEGQDKPVCVAQYLVRRYPL